MSLRERPRQDPGVRIEEQDPLRVDNFEPAIVRRRESAILGRQHPNVGKLAPDEIDRVVGGTAVYDDDLDLEAP